MRMKGYPGTAEETGLVVVVLAAAADLKIPYNFDFHRMDLDFATLLVMLREVIRV